MSFSLRVSSLVLCALIAACQGPVGREPDGTAMPQTVIHPGGGGTGALMVELPAGMSSAGVSAIVYKADAAALGAQGVSFNLPLMLDPDPTYCIKLGNLTDCTVSIVAGQTTTYTFGAVHVTYPYAAMGTDVGEYVTLNINTSDDKAQAQANVPSDATFLVLPGSYKTAFVPPATVDRSLFTASTIAVPQGQVVQWPLTIPEWRFRVHVVVPTSRQFPDVNGGVPYTLRAHAGGVSFGTPQSDLMIRVSSTTASAPYNCALTVFGMPLTIPVGAANTQVDIPTSRLDVADVAYTKPDGSAATVPGMWSVTRTGGAPGPDDNTLITYYGQNSFPTNRGVDVIAGTYNGTVVYNLADLGGQKTDSFNVTF